MKVDLRKSLFILPNLFTLSSVLCGYYAILLSSEAGADERAFYRAAMLIVFAMFFDTIDGRVARLTKTQSAIGVQLDSLADVISFGVAPGVLVYRWSLHELGNLGIAVCFAYIACGTIRLARFNVMATSPSGTPKAPDAYFLGLPIPAAAGILISLVVANTAARETSFRHILGTPWLILTVCVGLAFFMVSRVRFRSFKNLRRSWGTAAALMAILLSAAIVTVYFHASVALVWMLTGYVAIGVAETLWQMARGKRTAPLIAAPEEDADEEAEEALPPV